MAQARNSLSDIPVRECFDVVHSLSHKRQSLVPPCNRIARFIPHLDRFELIFRREMGVALRHRVVAKAEQFPDGTEVDAAHRQP